MLDGTPVLDIKPYVAYTDAIVTGSDGWLADADRTPNATDPIAAFDIHWDTLAASQAEWVESHTGLPIRARASATLALGPAPHPYRRIRRDGEGYVLAVKEWRARFSVDGRNVRVHEIVSGFRDSALARSVDDPQLGTHRDFHAHWPRRL
jgi:hypothetical protein